MADFWDGLGTLDPPAPPAAPPDWWHGLGTLDEAAAAPQQAIPVQALGGLLGGLDFGSAPATDFIGPDLSEPDVPSLESTYTPTPVPDPTYGGRYVASAPPAGFDPTNLPDRPTELENRAASNVAAVPGGEQIDRWRRMADAMPDGPEKQQAYRAIAELQAARSQAVADAGTAKSLGMTPAQLQQYRSSGQDLVDAGNASREKRAAQRAGELAQQTAQDVLDANAFQRSWFGRTAQRLIDSIGGAVVGTAAQAGELAGIPGADRLAESERDYQARREAFNQAMESGYPISTALSKAAATLGELGMMGGKKLLPSYIITNSLQHHLQEADARGDTGFAKVGFAAAHAAIDGSTFMLAGKVLGAPAQKFGGLTGEDEGLAGRFAQWLADKYSLNKAGEMTAKIGTGAVAQAVAGAVTTVAHKVAGGGEYDKQDIFDMLTQQLPQDLLVGSLAEGIHDYFKQVASTIAERQGAINKAKVQPATESKPTSIKVGPYEIRDDGIYGPSISDGLKSLKRKLLPEESARTAPQSQQILAPYHQYVTNDIGNNFQTDVVAPNGEIPHAAPQGQEPQNNQPEHSGTNSVGPETAPSSSDQPESSGEVAPEVPQTAETQQVESSPPPQPDSVPPPEPAAVPNEPAQEQGDTSFDFGANVPEFVDPVVLHKDIDALAKKRFSTKKLKGQKTKGGRQKRVRDQSWIENQELLDDLHSLAEKDPTAARNILDSSQHEVDVANEYKRAVIDQYRQIMPDSIAKSSRMVEHHAGDVSNVRGMDVVGDGIKDFGAVRDFGYVASHVPDLLSYAESVGGGDVTQGLHAIAREGGAAGLESRLHKIDDVIREKLDDYHEQAAEKAQAGSEAAPGHGAIEAGPHAQAGDQAGGAGADAGAGEAPEVAVEPFGLSREPAPGPAFTTPGYRVPDEARLPATAKGGRARTLEGMPADLKTVGKDRFEKGEGTLAGQRGLELKDEPAPKYPQLKAGEFEQNIRRAATSPDEAEQLIAIAKARAEAKGQTLDEWAASRIAGVEKGPMKESKYLKQHGEKQPPGTIGKGGEALAQKQGRVVRGETEFLNDGRAIIRAFNESQNVATLAHELGHVFRRDLDPDLLSKAEDALGVKDGNWQRVHEEKFARGFERYLRDGGAPTSALRTVFEKFKNWLTGVYKNLSQSPLAKDIPPQLKDVFDRMLGGDNEPAATKPEEPPKGGLFSTQPLGIIHPSAIPTWQAIDSLHELARNTADKTTIKPIPKLSRAGVENEAFEHASTRIAAPYRVRDWLSQVFPDNYHDPGEMAKTIEVLNADNVLGIYDDLRHLQQNAENNGDKRAASAYKRRADRIDAQKDVGKLDQFVQNASPEIRQAIDRVGKVVAPELDAYYHELKGLLPGTEDVTRGRHFGVRINLLDADHQEAFKNIGDERQQLPPEPTANYRNPNVKPDQFARHATGLGNYSTDAEAVFTNALYRRLNEVTKYRLYKSLVDKGAAFWEKPGDGKYRAFPVTVPDLNADGEPIRREARLWVKPGIASELRRVLDTEEHPQGNAVLRGATNAQIMMSLVDASAHLKNQHTVLTSSLQGHGVLGEVLRKIPGLSSVLALHNLYTTAMEVRGDTPQIRRELSFLARNGMLRPDMPKTSGITKYAQPLGRLLHASDTAVRVIANRFFDNLVDQGAANNTLENRRQFVNRVGNYNRRVMGYVQTKFRDLGFSPFIVAGRTFNDLSKGLVTGKPSFEATSKQQAIRARALMLSGFAVTAATPALINAVLNNGDPRGPKGTPIGAIGWKGDDGKIKTIDLFQMLGFRRGLRALGLNAVLRAATEKRSVNEVLGEAISDIRSAALHPWLGPGIGLGVTAMTGTKLDLRQGPQPFIARNVGGGALQDVENLRVALKNQNPILYAITQPALESIVGGDGDTRRENIIRGLSKAPLSAIGVQSLDTPAVRFAKELLSRHGTFQATDETTTRRDISAALREGNLGPLQEAQQAGKVSARSSKQLRQSAARPVLVNLVRNLTAEEALQVYEKSSGEEQKQIARSVMTKVRNALKTQSREKQVELRELLKNSSLVKKPSL